ncbi:MAG: cellulose biosynthesis cyclic di-GMP-binding regulatory protein BcsB [Cyanobacteria bacterium CAN_BIN43]|nr:cellulose biosynthesis cyclic di-GMP-binding regulatory protein BcsB [Cyanobacteria bacterium CAN_BIN43]
MFPFNRHRAPNNPSRKRRAWHKRPFVWFFCLTCLGTGLGLLPTLVKAQASVKDQPPPVIRQLALPHPGTPLIYQPQLAASLTLAQAAAPSPAVAPNPAGASSSVDPPSPSAAPSSPAGTPLIKPTSVAKTSAPIIQHVWEFNRNSTVGNRLRLEGVYPEGHVEFTRPRSWDVRSAQVQLRLQHSPSLLPDRSNITVRVNDTSIGSLPLGKNQGQPNEILFNIPVNLLEDRNDLSILTEQQTSDTCSNPADPTLWSEILPDSKVILNFRPKPIALSFSRYPYPFLDNLSLETNKITYLRPQSYSAEWLTAASRLETSLGRRLGKVLLNTQIVGGLGEVTGGDRLIVIGTPAEQPALAQLPLPFALEGGKFVDANQTVIPDDVGIVIMALTKDNRVPTLVATGNSPAGVAKAVQFLVQAKDAELGTGQALTVNALTEVPPPAPRNWTGYMPVENNFQLSDLYDTNGNLIKDTTVRGTSAPPVHIAFKALPDDRFLDGSAMTLRYSYSPQMDDRTSAVEIRIDQVTVASRRLSSNGGERETFSFRLPEEKIKPDSVMDVHFVMKPEAGSECGLEADQQLWGTVHANTSFEMRRDNVVRIPDLTLLRTGYPFTEPQDLSTAAIALPTAPTESDVQTLLAFSERLGRVSQAESVKTQVFVGEVPKEAKDRLNVVGIGTRDRLTVPEVFQEKEGFSLGKSFTRQWEQSQVQTMSDNEGVVKAIVSPWNKDRQLIAFTGQTEQGLKELQSLFQKETLFKKLGGDTLLISSNTPTPVASNPDDYNVQYFQAAKQRRVANTSVVGRVVLFLQDNWFMVPAGIAFVALPLYGFSQLYLNRIDQ